MSVAPSIEAPSVLAGTELHAYFTPQTATFLHQTLTRNERQLAVNNGVERARRAGAYLLGCSERPNQSTIFYVGDIAVPDTRATHILNHFGFKWLLNRTDGVVFDQLTNSYAPSLLEEKTRRLVAAGIQELPALYEVREHHNFLGEPGVISYLDPASKANHDQHAVIRLQEVEAAKSLVARA